MFFGGSFSQYLAAIAIKPLIAPSKETYCFSILIYNKRKVYTTTEKHDQELNILVRHPHISSDFTSELCEKMQI
ncbi:hypothetical protein QE152_g32223 [Popillia japonica]|uniref:Uncharacterized protein n=1 Tax=Popillia japonica TaxID=7064 RepID=A0AAW1IZG1_POPJA